MVDSNDKPILKDCKHYSVVHNNCLHLCVVNDNLSTCGQTCNLITCPRKDDIMEQLRKAEHLDALNHTVAAGDWMDIDSSYDVDNLQHYLHGIFVTLPQNTVMKREQINHIFNYFKSARWL